MPKSNRSSGSGSRGPVRAHTDGEVTAAAIALADRDGLPATTIRAVAAELGISPAALYRYIPSRSELIERMVDGTLVDLQAPEPSGDVVADLVELTSAQVGVLQRHLWLIDTLPSVPPGGQAIRVLEAGLRLLAPVAAHGAAKLETLAMLTGVATLFARASVEPDARTMAALAGAAAGHPHLAAAFADPGIPSPPGRLLRRTVESVVRGLLDLR